MDKGLFREEEMKRFATIFLCALMAMGAWKCTTFSGKKKLKVVQKNPYVEMMELFEGQPAHKVLFGWGLPRGVGKHKETQQMVLIYVFQKTRLADSKRKKMPPTPIEDLVDPYYDPSGTEKVYIVVYFFLKEADSGEYKGQIVIARVRREIINESKYPLFVDKNRIKYYNIL